MAAIVSPIDGSIAYQYERLDTRAAAAKIDRAAAVQRDWQTAPLGDRIAVCRRMLDRYADHVDEYAEQITRMMGKPLDQSRGEFLGGMRERTTWLCDVAPQALADDVLPDKPGFRRFIRPHPVGVVLDIAAWNYPLLIAVNVVVPAVLAGNAVLIKHASQTALVAEQLEGSFVAAGAPAGLVQAFHVTHDTAAEAIRSPHIGYVSFTGSVRGGHEVYRSVAAQRFVGCGLELGGKDPAFVLPDADFDFAIDNIVDGAFYNAGQSCCAVERVYVHRDIYDRFVEAFAAKVQKYVVGNPLDRETTLGPLVDEKAVAHVRGQVERALAAGARRIVAPEAFRVPDSSSCYMAPEVLIDVDHGMDLMSEETFGPAIGIMVVKDELEAIRLMNDSRYGLTGSVWTTDADRALAIAEQIETGTVYMNRCDYLDPALAWTGVKDSGFGCSLSRLGFLQVTRPKSYHFRLETRT